MAMTDVWDLDEAPLSISAVERDTGISKDTLRVWERRYRFPVPERDEHGGESRARVGGERRVDGALRFAIERDVAGVRHDADDGERSALPHQHLTDRSLPRPVLTRDDIADDDDRGALRKLMRRWEAAVEW